MRPAAARAAHALLAATVAACNAPHSEANRPAVGAFPQYYRADIVLAISGMLSETGYTHVHNAEVSEPVLTPIGSNQLHASCLRFTAIGRNIPPVPQERMVVFHHGQPTQFPLATSGQCRNAAYKPFPELEKACFHDKCK